MTNHCQLAAGLHIDGPIRSRATQSAFTVTLYATDQVRLKAAEQGADAITEPMCTINTKGDLSNNCYGNVNCGASAPRRADR